MNYKSKYTASEIDARLSQVFDSTLQTKEVEVSEDTTIKADEGFLGLKEVSVKVSGGGGGSASSVEYLDVSGVNNDAHIVLVNCAETTKSANDSGVYCGLPLGGLRAFFGMANNVDTVIAVGIDFSRKIKASDEQGQLMELSIIDFMTMMGINKEDIDALPRLTKEQFYAL